MKRSNHCRQLAQLGAGIFLALSLSHQPVQAQEFLAADELVANGDAAIKSYRVALLELAFDAVSGMPTVPHIKNRARAQASVVDVLFELDQPRRALDFLERIDNWRRGAGYADFVYYRARQLEEPGPADLVEFERHLRLAAEIAENPGDETQQAWRKDRIRSKIARAYIWLDRDEDAQVFERGLEDSELCDLTVAKVLRIDAETLEAEFAALDGVFSTGNFDQKRSALEACVALFGRMYENEELRGHLESKLESGWSALPLEMRLELLMKMVAAALLHDDAAKAVELLQNAQYIMEGGNWLPQDRIALTARLAALRYRAGDERRARTEVETARALFDAEREAIVDIFRADALRPLAEAFVTMGDEKSAAAVYRKALYEGAHNPNSWPRSVDLAETCSSMAAHALEPDEELWQRIREIEAGLGDPW